MMDQPTNEQALVHQLISGDPAAFRTLYERYAPRLAAFSAKLHASNAETDEIVQETFIRTWVHRHRLDPTQPFEAYIITIAKNLIYNHVRKIGHQQNYFREVSARAGRQEDPAVQVRELRDLIGKAMQQLPEKCRIVFRKSRLEGYTNAQIAEEMNISRSTVENQLNKALKIIRKNLESHGYGTTLVTIALIIFK